MARKSSFNDQLDRTRDSHHRTMAQLPMDGPEVGKVKGPLKSFEHQTPRETWQDMQGVVGPRSRGPNTVAPKTEQDGNPSIDNYNKSPSIVDEGGIARHPHW